MNQLFPAVAGICLCLCLPLLAADPFLAEFMPDNAHTLADEDGQFPDWLEIQNPGPSPVNLQGWFLTDDPRRLSKWSFPAVTVAPDDYLVVFASGKNRTNATSQLHTSFQLNAGGGYLALVKPDGVTVASAFAYPAVREDVAFGVAHCCFPQVAATKSGAIGCALYTYGPENGQQLIKVQLAISFDDAATFSELITVSDRSWDPLVNAPHSYGMPHVHFIGDYFGIDAGQDDFVVLWTDTRTGVQELFFDRIRIEDA